MHMILERLKDYYHLPCQIKAIDLLQHPESYPGLAPWREQDTCVSFVRLPSFQPYSVWTLQHRDKLYQVRRIEWDHATDYQMGDAVSAFPPTTFGSDAQLPVSAVRGLLDELTAISLPPFLPVATVGIDGVSFEIAFGNRWCSAFLSWWCEPPKEWRPLVNCYERAITLFEEHLPLSTALNPQFRTGE